MDQVQCAQLIELHMKTPTAAMFFEGNPGIGKTTIPRQIAKKLGIPFIYDNIPITEATERGGIPYVTKTNKMAYALLDNFPTTGPAIWLMDEFSKGDRIVQNCCSEIIQERTCRGVPISPECLIILTGNKRTNRAGDNEIPTHIRDRVTFYQMDVSLPAWSTWAAHENLDPIVRAFISRMGIEYLSKLDVKAQSSPSPRGWHRIATLLPTFNTPDTDNLIYDMVAGTVGVGIATEFEGFRRLASVLPHPDTIFANPHGAPIFNGVNEISIQYLLCTQLATHVTKKTIDACFAYLSRLPADLAAVCFHDIEARDPKLKGCAEGVKWCARNLKFMA